MKKLDKISIDFETRSEVDLLDVGAWIYSRDWSTDILCLAYKIPGHETKIWNRTQPVSALKSLFDAITETDLLVEAHNSFFELCLWENVGVPYYDFVPIPRERWSCSAAKAAVHAIPRSLDAAGKALGLTVLKDDNGSSLISKLSKPRKPTKDDTREWWEEHHTEITTHNKQKVPISNLFEQLYDYCVQDIEAEEALSNRLRDLTDNERQIWLLDQLVNARGLYVDLDLVKSCLVLLTELEGTVSDSVYALSNGVVTAATQRDKMLKWCESQKYPLDSLTAEAIEIALKDEYMPKNVRTMLELRQLGSKSSTKKFAKFLAMADTDWRIRGTLVYHGATTGRWAGKGIQPQNLSKGIFNTEEEIEKCIAIIKQENLKLLQSEYENPVMALSSVVRSLIMASPGHELFVADYSAIEARVLVWLVNDQNALNLFYEGKDIYIDMACTIFNLTPEQYKAKDEKKRKEIRAVGKDAILGLGYGMGWQRYQREALRKGGQKLENDFCQNVVKIYRQKYNKIEKYWYATEKAAKDAVDFNIKRSQAKEVGRVRWFMRGGFLCAELPSGRCLHFYKPELKPDHKFPGQTKLWYMGVHPKTKQWVLTETYGGRLVENICQAVARDIMSYAALRAERAGYKILTSIHDELVAERETGTGTVNEYEDLLIALEPWAEGCPIDAEGWKGQRYRK